MSNECKQIHELTRNLKRHKFPFENSEIPSNGIYLLFEKNESGHNQERIVRMWHTYRREAALFKIKTTFP